MLARESINIKRGYSSFAFRLLHDARFTPFLPGQARQMKSAACFIQ